MERMRHYSQPLVEEIPLAPFRFDLDTVADDILLNATVPVLRIKLSIGEMDLDSGQTSEEYVFAEKMQERWADTGLSLPQAIFYNTVDFLRRRGYKQLYQGEEPKAGDIVTYGTETNGQLEVRHFGILNNSSEVESKWEQRVVIKGDVNEIPAMYGDKALFFRKVSNLYAVAPERTTYGYYIPESEDREQIDQRFEGLDSLVGIDEIPSSITSEWIQYQCHQYAFGICHGQKWCRPDGTFFKVSDPIFTDPFTFLKQKGYDKVESPENDDIAVYGLRERGKFIAKHFGIWLGDGRVLSKFGDYEIVRHFFGRIINHYGNELHFVRKRA